MQGCDNGYVLVVDADDDLRAAMCAALRDADFRTTCVPDVAGARRKLATETPGVVLLCWDLHAGAIDKQALVDEVPEGTRLILMSTHPGTKAVADRMGVPFVAKPFDIDQFLSTVERASRPM